MYLKSDCASLAGGGRQEPELDCRVDTGHQEGAFWWNRTGVSDWTGHHHEPGEMANSAAGQLQGETEYEGELGYVNKAHLTSKKNYYCPTSITILLIVNIKQNKPTDTRILVQDHKQE